MAYENPYQAPTLTGYNSAPPSDDGQRTSSNVVRWATHLLKIGNPLKAFAQAVSSEVLAAFDLLPTRLNIPAWQLGPTAAETAAGVTVVSLRYDESVANRYANNTTPGTTDMTAAIQAALDVHHNGGKEARLLPETYLSGAINWPGNNLTLRGTGSAYSYNTSATPHTALRAKTGTTVLLDLVQTGTPEDRTGNLIEDIEFDGNSIATVGIDVSGANVIERCRVRRCTTAGVRFGPYINSTRLVRCGLSSNSGWGLQVDGAGNTTFTLDQCVLSLNTLGGADIEGGSGGHFGNCVFESNSGPGVRLYRPNSNTSSFGVFTFDTCWFEDNAATAPNFALVLSAGTSDPAYGPQKIRFRNCRFSSAATRKYMSADICRFVRFENCSFSGSTQSDAITLSSNARYVAFINSATGVGFGGGDGITATQMDAAIAQGAFCFSSDQEIKRVVGAGAPAAAFTNSWANNAGGTAAAYWFDSDGNVCIEGDVDTGTPPSSVFTLPVGYRPTALKRFAVDANGAYGLVTVNTDGTVVVTVGSATRTSLSKIRFSTS